LKTVMYAVALLGFALPLVDLPLPAEGKQVAGWLEKVRVYPGNLVIYAKMDTGAKYSSLNASNLTPFMRNGHQWVRFRVTREEIKARSAKAAGIPYAVVETNPETVRAEKSKGEPIFFGDATQEAVLAHTRIGEVRVLVVVISDPAATRGIVETARRLNQTLYIIARTRSVQEVRHLYELGANEVVPEEFETSVEIFTRVLAKYLMTADEIERFTAEVRGDGYEMLRSRSKEPTSLSALKLHIPDIEMSALRVHPGSPVVGEIYGPDCIEKETRCNLAGNTA
jgi:hypothetical protein